MMSDQPTPVEVPYADVVDAYRSRVRTAVGTAVEPHLWDAAIADATAQTVQDAADSELDGLRGDLDNLAARLADEEESADA